MFEIYLNNPDYVYPNVAGGPFGQVDPWADEPIVGTASPNNPRYIIERVQGVSATVESGNLIIIEGSGSVSALYPAHTWGKAVKINLARGEA